MRCATCGYLAECNPGSGTDGCSAHRAALVYVIGQHDAETAMQAAFYTSKVAAASSALILSGYDVLASHFPEAALDPMADIFGTERWRAMRAEMLQRADAVVLVPGWDRSAEAVRERVAAHDLGKPIYDLGDLVPVPECLN